MQYHKLYIQVKDEYTPQLSNLLIRSLFQHYYTIRNVFKLIMTLSIHLVLRQRSQLHLSILLHDL